MTELDCISNNILGDDFGAGIEKSDLKHPTVVSVHVSAVKGACSEVLKIILFKVMLPGTLSDRFVF